MRLSIRSVRAAAVLLALTALAACGGGTDTTPHTTARGPAHMAILSGDHQVAPVAAPSLPKPVVGQLYRAPDGQVAFRWYDAVLPARAYADTVVTAHGAPVAGAVVCWADVPGAPRLIPFSVCTSTSDSGMVAFNVRPDTTAGLAKGQVHWDSAGTPIVTDSVVATVTPGPLARWFYNTAFPRGATKDSAVHIINYFNGYADEYRNPLSPDSVIATTKIRSAWSPADLSARPYQCAAHGTPTDSAWTITAPDSVAAWPSLDPDGDNACLWLWIGSDTANAAITMQVH